MALVIKKHPRHSLPLDVKELHQRIRSGLDFRAKENSRRRSEADDIIKACEAVDAQIAEQRRNLEAVEKMYLAAMTGQNAEAGEKTPEHSADADESDDAGGKQKRNRIGPQRYFMFDALRRHGPLDAASLANATSLPVRRIREQMAIDAKRGNIEAMTFAILDGGIGPRFKLTKDGESLLAGFLDYRQRRGIPLPTHEEAMAEQFEMEGT